MHVTSTRRRGGTQPPQDLLARAVSARAGNVSLLSFTFWGRIRALRARLVLPLPTVNLELLWPTHTVHVDLSSAQASRGGPIAGVPSVVQRASVAGPHNARRDRVPAADASTFASSSRAREASMSRSVPLPLPTRRERAGSRTMYGCRYVLCRGGYRGNGGGGDRLLRPSCCSSCCYSLRYPAGWTSPGTATSPSTKYWGTERRR